MKQQSTKKKSRLLQKLVFTFQCLLIVGTAYFAFSAGLAIKQFAYTHSMFSIRKITIAGSHRCDNDILLSYSHIKKGDNIFRINSKSAEHRIEQHPWIKKVKVVKSYPDSINILLEEHEPLALLSLSSLYFINPDGLVFKKYSGESITNIPIITSEDGDNILADSNLLKKIIAFYKNYRDNGYQEKFPISEIHHEPFLGMSLYLKKSGTKIELGDSTTSSKMIAYLDKVQESLEQHGIGAAIVRLNESKNKNY